MRMVLKLVHKKIQEASSASSRLFLRGCWKTKVTCGWLFISTDRARLAASKHRFQTHDQGIKKDCLGGQHAGSDARVRDIEIPTIEGLLSFFS